VDVTATSPTALPDTAADADADRQLHLGALRT
jgi:hypothetical protein